MKTMNFKSTCKFCGVSNLSWVELHIGEVKKWVLFKTETDKHICLSSAKKKADAVDEKALEEQKTWENKVKASANKPSQKQIAFKEKMQAKKPLKGKELEKAYTKAVQSNSEKKLDKEVTDIFNKLDEGAEKVKLFHATSLYQPVSASSVGSTYYVVAMWEGLNMACRIKTFAGYYTISIRIEGSNYEKWSNLDMLAKFNHSSNYASAHYNAKNITEVNAVIYSFIGMINKPALSPMPDLSKIL